MLVILENRQISTKCKDKSNSQTYSKTKIVLILLMQQEEIVHLLRNTENNKNNFQKTNSIKSYINSSITTATV